MKTVHILRHAKSDWADEGVEDHQRPLAERGRRAGNRLREHLDKHPLELDLVLCSTARRARETLELIRPALGDAAVKFEDDFYGAGPDLLLARLRKLPKKVASVLLVGHNPGSEQLAAMLAPGSAPDHFPTAALATIELPSVDWSSIREGSGRVRAFLVPADLKNA